MSVDKSIENATEAAKQMATGAPQWVATMAIVALFVLFLWAQGQQELEAARISDRVTEHRIEVCHDVQTQSLEAMHMMAESLQGQRLMMQEMIIEMKQQRRIER